MYPGRWEDMNSREDCFLLERLLFIGKRHVNVGWWNRLKFTWQWSPKLWLCITRCHAHNAQKKHRTNAKGMNNEIMQKQHKIAVLWNRRTTINQHESLWIYLQWLRIELYCSLSIHLSWCYLIGRYTQFSAIVVDMESACSNQRCHLNVIVLFQQNRSIRQCLPNELKRSTVKLSIQLFHNKLNLT